MKVWQMHRRHALTGAWHVHTNYTDGEHSVAEMAERAVELGLPLIAFTEHVRRKLDYDFGQFYQDVLAARNRHRKHGLIVLTGCEAKILPGGELDAPPNVLLNVDHVVASFHRFDGDSADWAVALWRAIENPLVGAWGHPGRWLVNRDGEGVTEDTLTALARHSSVHGVAWEDSAVPGWIAMGNPTYVLRAPDAHRVGELA